MLGHVIHDHTLHKTLHQIYIVLSETGMQSEEARALDKSFRKTFGEEKRKYSIKIRVFKEAQIPTELDLKPLCLGTRR